MEKVSSVLKNPVFITTLILVLIIGGVIGVLRLIPDNAAGSAEYVEQYWGDPNAKVVVEEFGDLQCPGCRVFNQSTEKELQAKYSGKIKFIFHHYPLPIHPNAQNAAEATEAAGAQGKFWEYHDLLYARQQSEATLWTTEKLTDYARELGLDTDRFKRELSQNYYKEAVNKSAKIAKDRNITATPTLYVNGKEVKGPLDPSSGQQTIADFDSLEKAILEVLGQDAKVTSTPTVTATPS